MGGKSEPTGARLLDIATDHVRKHGLERTSVVSVAREAQVSHAAVYRYFEIGKEMSLRQVLAVEARAYILSEGLTEREATFLSPNRVQLAVSTQSPRNFGASGKVLLERRHTGQPFHVVRPMPRPAPDGLVTYCVTAKSDDDFLRVGCDWYY